MIAQTELLLQIIDGLLVIFKRWKAFLFSQKCLKWRAYKTLYLIFCHSIAA